MGIWEGPLLFVALMVGVMILFQLGKSIFVDLLGVDESKYSSVAMILFLVGLVALFVSSGDGAGNVESEPGIDYWIRP